MLADRRPVGPKCADLGHIVLTHNELHHGPRPGCAEAGPLSDKARHMLLHLLKAVHALDLSIGILLDRIEREVPDLRYFAVAQHASGHGLGQVGGVGVDLDLAEDLAACCGPHRRLPDPEEVRVDQRLPQPEQHQRIEARPELSELFKERLGQAHIKVATLAVVGMACFRDRAVHTGQAAQIGQLEDEVGAGQIRGMKGLHAVSVALWVERWGAAVDRRAGLRWERTT